MRKSRIDVSAFIVNTDKKKLYGFWRDTDGGRLLLTGKKATTEAN